MGFRSAPAVIVLCAPWTAGGAEHESLPAPRSVLIESRPDSKSAPAEQAATPLETARRLEAARDWPGLVACMEQRAQRAALTPEEERLFASGLEQLGRLDEAAQHMDLCALGYERAGRDKESKAAQIALRRIDPLSARRDSFLHLASTTMLEAARELLDDGDAERALRIARGLPRIARGKDATAANQLLARARAAFEKVELTRADAPDVAPKAKDAVIELETAHYRLACRLEPDVVERLGHLMDDIHAFYVRVYFDGDAKRARSAKATIRIAPDKETMLLAWEGTTGPEGWWSPGTNEVHAYDTRGTTGSLDDMLETLFHEASHQFMTLLAGGSGVPAWLNEGTSSFFEGTVAMADGRVLWPRAAPRRLEALQVQIARQQAPRLRDVILYDQPGSYPAEYYAWGWGLVYYLLEYEDPTTLQQVYRPLYASYRSEVIQKGAPTFDLFAKWFLGERSPRNHPDFSSFEREWESWIQDEVVPLHGHGAKARALRLARIERLISAADVAEAGGKKKNAVDAQDFLARALVHFEWIRTQIDKDTPDAELLLRQVDVLERLNRNSSAASLVEDVLDLADSGKYALDDERRAALEKRLTKLDHKNAALRAARRRSGELARTGLALIDDYREAGSILRAWTLAADLAALLGDPLQSVATQLREEVRARGLLQGSMRELSSAPGPWEPLLETPLEKFETGASSALLDGVRAGAMVDTSFEVTGEYVLRATLRPEGARDPGWTAGFVVAGAPEHGSTMVGLDDRGLVGIWTINAASAGATTLRRTRTISIERPVAAGTPIDLEVHARADGTLSIRVGDRTAVDARIDVAPGGARHVGLFVRSARVTFADPRVELVP